MNEFKKSKKKNKKKIMQRMSVIARQELQKEYKNHQEERITRAVFCFLFFLAATQWSFNEFTRPSADNTDLHSLVHSLTRSFNQIQNAVVLQGKVHQFNSNLVVSHEECQSNKPKNNHHGNTFSMT